MVQTLTDIKSLLAMRGLHPRHRFGQNFLHDANQMQRIIAAAEPTPGSLILEVGPGTGALSEWLLDAGARLVVVEIDRDLEPILRERLEAKYGDRVTILIQDVLAGKHEIDPRVFETLRAVSQKDCETAPPEGGARTPLAVSQPSIPPFKLVANLPYNVASPLLANLALDHPEMALAVVMIQREVADRLTALPGGKEYGPLGVLIQAAYHVDRVATLSPGSFWPQPKVDSAVVRLRRREQPLAGDLHKLSATLHTLFSKRRKQIGAILGRATALPPGIDPQARPEQLGVEQLIAISQIPI